MKTGDLFHQFPEDITLTLHEVVHIDASDDARFFQLIQEVDDVEAETKEEAIAIAKKDNPHYYINTYAREVEEKKYTTTEKDRLIARIAELEETLAGYKKDLERLEKGA